MSQPQSRKDEEVKKKSSGAGVGNYIYAGGNLRDCSNDWKDTGGFSITTTTGDPYPSSDGSFNVTWTANNSSTSYSGLSLANYCNA